VVDLLKREKTHEVEEVVSSRLKNW
jgi:hypothetical protein